MTHYTSVPGDVSDHCLIGEIRQRSEQGELRPRLMLRMTIERSPVTGPGRASLILPRTYTKTPYLGSGVMRTCFFRAEKRNHLPVEGGQIRSIQCATGKQDCVKISRVRSFKH